jgi:hypothetical protein
LAIGFYLVAGDLDGVLGVDGGLVVLELGQLGADLSDNSNFAYL